MEARRTTRLDRLTADHDERQETWYETLTGEGLLMEVDSKPLVWRARARVHSVTHELRQVLRQNSLEEISAGSPGLSCRL